MKRRIRILLASRSSDKRLNVCLISGVCALSTGQEVPPAPYRLGGTIRPPMASNSETQRFTSNAGMPRLVPVIFAALSRSETQILGSPSQLGALMLRTIVARPSSVEAVSEWSRSSARDCASRASARADESSLTQNRSSHSRRRRSNTSAMGSSDRYRRIRNGVVPPRPHTGTAASMAVRSAGAVQAR